MKKYYIIKNSETNKYYTNDYDNFWDLNIKYAQTYLDLEELDKEIEKLCSDYYHINAFEDVPCVIIETIYFT